MPEVLIVSDSPQVRNEVVAALPGPDFTVRHLDTGTAVLPALVERRPDLVVLDLQIGRMGGMAVALDLKLEADAGRAPSVPVIMLLDRRADVFLARRAGVQGWVVKPLDAMRMGRAISAVLAGGTYEDPSYRPVTVPPR